MDKKREVILSFKAKMDQSRNLSERLADVISNAFGSTWFFLANFIWFLGWIVVNTDLIPGIPVFDPFPFGLLTMIVSLEAIFLSIFVLISQNRAAKIADLREEIDLQINVRAEQEITRILVMLDEIHDHLGLEAEDDEELRGMKEKTDLSSLEMKILSEMDN